MVSPGHSHYPRDGVGAPREVFGETSAFRFMADVGSPDGRMSRPSMSHQTNLPQLDDAQIARSFMTEDIGDPFELPQRSTADRLVDSYFRHRHPLNPCLHEGTFQARYGRLWLGADGGGEEASQRNLHWLGLVNMVFAFGTDYAQSSSRQVNDRTRYFKRARHIVIWGVLQSGTIELVQALLLIGQYLHGSLELNDCWTIVGLAIRTSQGLGLHLDETAFTTNLVEQEIRKRTWWGCFVLDRVLSTKVGRPPAIHDEASIKVGLPRSVDDEYLTPNDPNSRQPADVPSTLEYFNHVISQCRLMQKVMDAIYGGNSVQIGRERTAIETHKLLARTIELDGELDAWKEGLPEHLRPSGRAQEWRFERQRNTLLMRSVHYATQVVRPLF